MSRRGVSLLEVMVAVAVMGVLITSVFGIFKMGISAWFKTDGLTDLVQQGQLVGARWVRDVETTASSAVSVTPAGDAISLPSARDVNGNFVLDATTNEDLVWTKYVLYYYDNVAGEVRRAEVPINPATRAVVPIESYNGPSGRQPLSFYLNGGTVIARQVTAFQVGAGSRIARLTVTAQKPRPQTTQLETSSSSFSALMRN